MKAFHHIRFYGGEGGGCSHYFFLSSIDRAKFRVGATKVDR